MTEQPVKRSRSVSQWKSLTTCGERYRLERMHRKDLPTRPAAWTIGGSAFHEAVMDWEKGRRRDDLAELFVKHYDRMVEEEKVKQPNLKLWMKPPRTKETETDIKNYRKRFLEKDIPNYLKRMEEAEWEIAELPSGELALELEFEMQFGEVTVRGALDRIQWWPKLNANAMEDLKTGSPDSDDDHRQLGLYRIAAAEVYDIDLVWGRYWYTKLDRPSDSWVDLSRYTREYFEEEFAKVDAIIANNLFLANPGKSCGICSVRPWCRELGNLKIGESL